MASAEMLELRGRRLNGGAVDHTPFSASIPEVGALIGVLQRYMEDYIDPELIIFLGDQNPAHFTLKFIEPPTWGGDWVVLTTLTQFGQWAATAAKPGAFILSGTRGNLLAFTLSPVLQEVELAQA